MHGRGVAHLDLKLNNIVFRDKHNDARGLNVLKIIDFGLSEQIQDVLTIYLSPLHIIIQIQTFVHHRTSFSYSQ